MTQGADPQPFGLAEVERAAGRIAGRVHRTPVLTSRLLDRELGCRVLLKAEHLQRTGAFKARGAFSALLALDPAERARGVLAVSSGNHGQAVALAAAETGGRAVVVMPAGSTPTTLVAGERPLTAAAVPAISPPPPTGTRTRSRPGASSSSSRAAVPWPAITSWSSKGWTRRRPRVAASSAANVSRFSPVTPSMITSAP